MESRSRGGPVCRAQGADPVPGVLAFMTLTREHCPPVPSPWGVRPAQERREDTSTHALTAVVGDPERAGPDSLQYPWPDDSLRSPTDADRLSLTLYIGKQRAQVQFTNEDRQDLVTVTSISAYCPGKKGPLIFATS